MPPPAELLIPRENNLRKILAKRWPKKIKRAGPSHKPHPKATCPHPTRPLRPPGRRARDDYAQLTLKMQPKALSFFHSIDSSIKHELLFVIPLINFVLVGPIRSRVIRQSPPPRSPLHLL